jgi:ABC-type uncharacterized transport system involved in gliding motility auxiliary subunit
METEKKSILDRYWKESRQNRYGAYLVGYVAVMLLLLGGLNYLANRFNKSFDATANQRYTLSDQTEKVVATLREEVRLQLFDESVNFGPARDLLSLYDDLSTRLRVEYVDIDQKPMEARAAGVTARGELVLSMGDRVERASNLSEEEITRALVRLAREGGRKACVLQGSGEAALDSSEMNGLSNLNVLLRNSSYEIEPVNPLVDGGISGDCTVVIVAGPQTPYPDAVVSTLEGFVEAGGSMLLMLDPPMERQGLRTEDDPALLALAAKWGVTVEPKLLLGRAASIEAALLGPLTLVVNEYRPHPVTSTLGGGTTVFPEARPLQVNEDNAASVQVLFESGANSYAADDYRTLQREFRLSELEQGPFVLAVAGTRDVEGAASDEPKNADNRTEGRKGRFIIVGTRQWATNASVARYENRNLLVNMINWLAADEDLISIPPKSDTDTTIVLSPVQLQMVNFASLVVVPLLVVLIGVLVWLRRR